MSGIVDFFQEIAGLVVSLVGFLINAIQSAINMLLQIPAYLSYVYDIFSVLPAFLQVVFVLAFAIMVIWLIRSFL